ncbi:tetratricopeptide repeat protein [Streptomyces sp. NPDC001595]|uniref:tetratricopeptide repeat protein n=1 Tax=Streptomyces sp. NPDC001532 TaxID=3154520 RepID=UPI003326F8FF
MAETERYDVFFSYAFADGQWPVALAENLERLGLDVWFDRWELLPGQPIATRLQDGLARADTLVAVVSPRWVASQWCGEEFAAAMKASTDGRQRVIPVLWGDAPDAPDLPPFVLSRLYVDFRTVATAEQYTQRVDELARAVRGRTLLKRPERTGRVVVPGGMAYRPDGPVQAELRIGAGRVEFAVAGAEVAGAPLSGPAAEPDQHWEELLWALRRARERVRGTEVTRATTGAQASPFTAEVNGALTAVGQALGERFTVGDVAQALRRETATARAGHTPLRIGLQVTEPRWRDLPWETLVVPGDRQPLVLSEGVELYRAVEREAAPVALQVPGPLRILAVVASPEAGGGELLDYEGELALILDAVASARAREGTYVRVLNWGSVGEIRAALVEERFHVLHLSCHAGPGVLYLETDDGGVDEVDARRFMDEVLPAGRGVPLVVLSGCSTAQTPERVRADADRAEGDDGGRLRNTAPADDDAAAEARTGLARELLARGVPAVLAMTEAVTDRYATALTAHVYEELARSRRPMPLAALSRARRRLESVRRHRAEGDPRGALPEWATPSLFLAGPPLPLFDAAQNTERPTPAPEPVLDEGMVVRKVGDFVGRRAELRRLLGALRDPDRAGVLIHGIGGVGKSTLTAELLHHLGVRAGLVVPVSAATAPTVDSVLETLRRRLVAQCLAMGLPENDPLRQVAAALTDATPPWRDRWELIRQLVLPRLPMLLLLDNAEDLLTPSPDGRHLTDPELAAFLAAWTSAAPATRLLITSRFPFALPRRMHRRLLTHHLGPLTLAETRKLIWRLPGLDALPFADQQRAYTDVGGHPRALEYLDALLRGGRARFPDIADRMEDALERRGVPHPERWLASVAGDLDRALAETVTLAVDDVLLDSLLAQLDRAPGARRLLEGLAVHRTPVDRTGAAWHLSEVMSAPDPDQEAMDRVRTVRERIERAAAAGASEEDDWGLEPETVAQFTLDRETLLRPPVELDEAGERALALLLELGLVSPAPVSEDDQGTPPAGLVIHRWTADALQSRTDAEALVTAHRRATAYSIWYARAQARGDVDNILRLVEARHHSLASGDGAMAGSLTQHICMQLHTWGAWDWEQRLVEESLAAAPPRSQAAAMWLHQLGLIEHRRGAFDDAQQHFQDSLAISEEQGNRGGIGSTYHQLGMIAQERQDFDAAERYYRLSLAISEELDERLGIAITRHQLGIVAHERGQYDEAEHQFRASLAISEELRERNSIGSTYHQLGMIAEKREDYEAAEQYYRASLAISEELNERLGIAISRHQLGILAERREAYDEAEQFYRSSLALSEEVGNRGAIASTISQLGLLKTRRDQPEQAVPYNLQALAMRLEMRVSPTTDLTALGFQRRALGDDRFHAVLLEHASPDDAATIMEITDPGSTA